MNISSIKNFTAFAILGLLAAGTPLNTTSAETPGILNYQGTINADGTPFTGTGSFKFALVDSTGTTTHWSHDGTSANGSEPTSSISLEISGGRYAVALGDTTVLNMTEIIPIDVFADNSDVRLRLWFDDGTNGSQLLSPDHRIASVGYAMVAGQALGVSDSSITTASISDGSITADDLAPGAIHSLDAVDGSSIAVVHVDADGEVGIGTDSPSEQLELTGNLLLPEASDDTSGLILFADKTQIHSLGTRNFFAGENSGALTSSGSENVGVGTDTLRSITSGRGNVAIGAFAMLSTTSGSFNVAIGRNVMTENSTGSENMALGMSSMTFNTTGSFNTGVGRAALLRNNTGSLNTGIGYRADLGEVGLTNATAIGANAVVDASNKIRLGDENVTLVETDGTISAAAFLGDGSALTGINVEDDDADATNELQDLVAVLLQGNDAGGNDLTNIGIVTANQLIGDGSHITNIPGGIQGLLSNPFNTAAHLTNTSEQFQLEDNLFWQSFIPMNSGWFKGLRLQTNAAVNSTLTLNVYLGEGNSGTLLASYDLSVAEDPDDAFYELLTVDLDTDTRLYLSSGVTYSVELHQGGTEFIWEITIDNDYADGRNNHDIDGDHVFDIVALANINSLDAIPILDDSVTTDSILDGTITSADILDGTILSNDIANGTINSNNVLDDSLTGSDIQNGTLTEDDLNLASLDISGAVLIDVPVSENDSPEVLLTLEAHDDTDTFDLSSGSGARLLFKVPVQNDSATGASIDAVRNSTGESNSSTNLVFSTSTSTPTLVEAMRLTSGGDLLLAGDAYKPGGGPWLASSDRRLKRNIEDYDKGLSDVLKIRPVRFQYNNRSGHDTEATHVGVIAQELQEVDADMIGSRTIDGEEYLTVDSSAMTYMLINAIKEQQTIIEAQQKQIDALDSHLSELSTIRAQLESQQKIIDSLIPPSDEPSS